MAFADEINAFALKVKARNQAAFAGIVAETANSIKFGSPLTGAPGQPVDTGNLLNSWQTEFESPESALIASGGTASDYNRAIEDGVGPHGPLTLRSAVGGFHSVALTIAGFDKIVASEAAKVAT